MTTKVNCPTCDTTVVWDKSSEFRPFCSKRCQLIDLGQWANEEHKVSGSSVLSSDENGDAEIKIDVEDIEAMLSEQSDDFFKS
ncbi:DNA gyrase inhibitor YacG [Glaciecola siphonariae]|uniref:DNA gyrase inhibitor YacG n=1 Tax=Glaciecola siphonariae TaxID=521012 RepID=A0ABV9LWQ6_9ALTE